MQPTKWLNRYTTLPIAIDILTQKSITLLDPKSWEDHNDSYYLEKYKGRKKLKSLLALCFTSHTETFHNWKVFAGGTSGVCIQFNTDKIINSIKSIPGIEYKMVQYHLIRDVKKNPPPLDDWPFIKRSPYKDEREFRIIYKNSTSVELSKKLPICLDCIEKITLSP
jgi:hypothetical protein